MNYKEYEVIRLKHDIESHNLTKGMIGAILMVYKAESPRYEVEFCDSLGITIALITLSEEDIEKVECPSNRRM